MYPPDDPPPLARAIVSKCQSADGSFALRSVYTTRSSDRCVGGEKRDSYRNHNVDSVKKEVVVEEHTAECKENKITLRTNFSPSSVGPVELI